MGSGRSMSLDVVDMASASAYDDPIRDQRNRDVDDRQLPCYIC